MNVKGVQSVINRSARESNMDTTTLLIIILIVLILFGGGWYGRGRWF
jgi:Sec-independent protein translocase protein TatA